METEGRWDYIRFPVVVTRSDIEQQPSEAHVTALLEAIASNVADSIRLMATERGWMMPKNP